MWQFVLFKITFIFIRHSNIIAIALKRLNSSIENLKTVIQSITKYSNCVQLRSIVLFELRVLRLCYGLSCMFLMLPVSYSLFFRTQLIVKIFCHGLLKKIKTRNLRGVLIELRVFKFLISIELR